MDQTSATTPPAVPAQAQGESPPLDAPPPADAPGFGARGRVRRRARFLRKARELAYRDLGGLVFSLHRFGQRNDALVLAKLDTLSRFDTELRALEGALNERQTVTVLREAGITACPRCAAIHGSEDRFCPNCGLQISGHAALPITSAPVSSAANATAPAGDPQSAGPVAQPPSAGAQTPTPSAPRSEQNDEEPTEIVRPPAPGR